MKQNQEVPALAKKVLNWGLLIILWLFMILTTAITSNAQHSPKTGDSYNKNMYLKKWKKEQQKMQFKGIKKRRGKYKVR
jgi:hypothetical protein